MKAINVRDFHTARRVVSESLANEDDIEELMFYVKEARKGRSIDSRTKANVLEHTKRQLKSFRAYSEKYIAFTYLALADLTNAPPED